MTKKIGKSAQTNQEKLIISILKLKNLIGKNLIVLKMSKNCLIQNNQFGKNFKMIKGYLIILTLKQVKLSGKCLKN